MISIGVNEMQGQTNPNRPLNNLQVSQVNALGSINFEAQTDASIEETLNKQAREMQNTYGVHIDLAYTLVRINYLATSLTTTGNGGTDIANLRTWRQNNLPGADARDLNAGFFMGNSYTGESQQGPDVNGYRYTAIASPTLSWLLDHEDKHTVDALNNVHDEPVTNINFTATNITTGVPATLSDGYTNGSPAGTSGTRLQYLSVSNAKNTGNPANGGDGNTLHIGEYFADEYEISTPYTELQNDTGAGNTADKVADYYAAAGPGHDFRNESVALPATPVAQVAGDVISLTNSGAYVNTYPNTTNPAFEGTYFTPGKYELYLYDAAAATDHNQIAGPIEIDESFSGLAAGDYKLGIYEKFGNTEIRFSSTITVEVGDTTPPTIITQPGIAELNGSGNTPLSFSMIDNGSFDDSGTFTVVAFSPTSANCSDVGDVTVNFTLEDPTGNQSSGSETIDVQDNLAPTFSTQNQNVAVDTNGMYTINPADAVVGLDDNCDSSPALSANPATLDCADLGANTIIISAEDNEGNITTHNVVYTIVDNISPNAITQNLTVNIEGGPQTITAAQVNDGSTDNCGIDTMNIDLDFFDTVGTFNGIFTAADASSNSDNAGYTVEVINTTNTPPPPPENFTIDNVQATTADAESDISVDSDGTTETYKWFIDTNIDGIPNGTQVGSTTGVNYTYADLDPETPYEAYNKAVDNEGGISEASNIEIFNTTLGIEDQEIAGFAMYPNPAGSSVNIEIDGQLDDIEIYDINGRLIKEIDPQGLSKINVSLDYLSSGMYFIETHDKEGRNVVKRLVKN